MQRAGLAVTSKTLYVKGGWGQLATAKNKKKAIALYDYNKEREAAIMDAPYKTWFFDCVCFIKGLLWGWNCNYGSSNGGAEYKANGFPDCTCGGMLLQCGENVFPISDKTYLYPGAVLYMKNGRTEHVGLYAGQNKVIECSPSLGGVKVTDISYQKWERYGLLECITYANEPEPVPVDGLRKGTKIICNNTPLYVSCDAKKPANHVTGYFYISDGIEFNGRYRICKERMYCGAINKVWGYVNKGDIKCVR